MKQRSVVLAAKAINDLIELHARIASSSSAAIATAYIARIEDYCRGFDLASERGHRRDDLAPRLRTVGFERRATIAFTVSETTVTILRVFHGGRDWEHDLEEG